MNAPPPKELRPPLPRGPFLVVGLARSGVAAAKLLAGRGERVIGVDSGSPVEAAGLRGSGRRSPSGYGWIGSTRWDADRRQEPGRAPGGAV